MTDSKKHALRGMFPVLFKDCAIDCSDEWFDLLTATAWMLEQADPKLQLKRVSEKLRMLRFDTVGPPDRLTRQILSVAESLSGRRPLS